MKIVGDVVRTKKTYNMSLSEFKKGEWLTLIPNSEDVEVTYKGHYLVVHDFTKILRTAEKAGEEDGR